MATYQLGQSRTFAATFRTATGALYDPPKVRYKRLTPASSTPTTYLYPDNAQLVRDGVGQYHVDEVFPLSKSYVGDWLLRFEALESDLTTPQTTIEYAFMVEGSRFYP